MADHLILVVHGMGTHDATWADDALADLHDQYARYTNLARDFPLAQSVKFVGVSYGAVFDTYLAAAKAHSGQFNQWIGTVGMPVPGMSTAGNLAKLLSSDHFIATHLGDVLLYMLTDLREKAKANLLHTIRRTLDAHPYTDWSILAHSLGTRVVTDALQAWRTTPEIKGSHGKARLVMMVANVARVLQRLVYANTDAVYHNEVFPSSVRDVGACHRYISTHHELDPFTCLAPYDPAPPFGAGGRGEADRVEALRLNAGDLTGKNPHDLAHYLRHPKVHRALFRALLDVDLTTPFLPQDVAAVDDEYRRATAEGWLQDARARLQQTLPSGSDSGDRVVDKWERFLETVR